MNHARTLLLALTIVSLPTGCRTTVAEKEAAFRPWEAHVIEGRPAAEFLAARRVSLIGGADGIRVFWMDGRVHLEYSFEPRDVERTASGFSFDFTMPELTEALAVPLEEPGWFLTAAHAADHPPLHVLRIHGESARAAPAEVVWIDEEADLALLRADLGDIPVFRWAEDPSAGETVLAATMHSPSAGTLRDLGDPTHADLPTREVEHDAPVRDGDSGAAIVDLSGRLIAVHSATGVSLTGLRKTRLAGRPDPARLRELVRAGARPRQD